MDAENNSINNQEPSTTQSKSETCLTIYFIPLLIGLIYLLMIGLFHLLAGTKIEEIKNLKGRTKELDNSESNKIRSDLA